MKDNDLIALFASQLDAGLAAAGLANYAVTQNYQPTQEGVPSGPFVFFEKLFDKEYGWPIASDYWMADVAPPGSQLPDFSTPEQQWVESTFQVTPLVLQDVSDLSIPTQSDVAHLLKQYLNARQVMAVFRASGVSVLRITDIRNPKFEDERGLFEANPNFDVILQHKRVLDFRVPGSNTVVGERIVGV